jgi:predicted Ser/Thr protein kinase
MLPEEVGRALEDPRNRFGGKYVLLGTLGRGGMGEVWKAWEIPLSRYVAIKMLRNQLDAEALARFEREARLAARLNHPNIAGVYELAQHEGRVFIAMQFIDGETFDARERPPREAAAAMRDVAHALAYAHQMGVVHRDINPHNVMVARDGRAFVTDFGIARQSRRGSTVTETGMVVGTPAYMSPEQAEGKALDERTDVYSLGATLYFAAAQSPPYLGDEPMQVLRRLAEEDPVPIRKLNPRVDRALTTIVETAMRRDPAKRYGTMRAMAADLDAYVEGRPISARPEGFLARLLVRGRRRSRLTVASVALIVIGTVVGTLALAGVGRTRAGGRRDAVLALHSQLEQIVRDFEALPAPTPERARETRDRVERTAAEILSIDARFGYAHLEAARFLWAAGERDAAYRRLELAVQSAPTSPALYLFRARFRFKEYISMQARRLGQAALVALVRGFEDPDSPEEEPAELRALVEQGTDDLRRYSRLARRQPELRGSADADQKFAEAIQRFYAGEHAAAAAALEGALGSAAFASDARALLAIVRCLEGAYEEIETHLEGAGLRPAEAVEIRVFIGSELLRRLPGPEGVRVRAALVENLARLSLRGGNFQALTRLPPMFFRGELQRILDDAERRAARIRAGG